MTTLPLVYTGLVRHRRYLEKYHQFSYSLFMFCFDTLAPESSFKDLKTISVEKFNWFSFRRKNYLNHLDHSLDKEARTLVNQKLGFYPQGKIYLLTHLSCLGYCFNPISLYMVYHPNSSEIAALIIEVTNTPWGEKHLYVEKVSSPTNKNNYTCQFKKELHVSPFMGMDYDYRFHLKVNDKRIVLHINSFKQNQKHFDASLVLNAVESTPAKIYKVFKRHPLMTFKVTAAIHWQALKLWMKGITYHSHPNKQDRNNGKSKNTLSD